MVFECLDVDISSRCCSNPNNFYNGSFFFWDNFFFWTSSERGSIFQSPLEFGALFLGRISKLTLRNISLYGSLK
ncbi:hypothetical protein RclHR1_00830011 [Rhizophagus clarus]|uniref:Uncharacterized protein n=1 Tax=Rhizophagus clarus TaxID=94130 RepID=A0A2Z6SES7_9GLOM|nr:hypothetical protein RclHR1_00830011 [Rhizophagus clarus]